VGGEGGDIIGTERRQRFSDQNHSEKALLTPNVLKVIGVQPSQAP
jgi:hypothetical protein